MLLPHCMYYISQFHCAEAKTHFTMSNPKQGFNVIFGLLCQYFTMIKCTKEPLPPKLVVMEWLACPVAFLALLFKYKETFYQILVITWLQNLPVLIKGSNSFD